MRKNYLLCIRLETEDYESLKKQASEEKVSFSELCRKKLRGSPQLNKIELALEEIKEKLKCSTKFKQEVKMVKQLPEFKGYTVDERLKQFRKVDREKPSIEFVDFDSQEGKELLQAYEEQNEE